MVESYDRLVAQGYLEARRGAGFFTTAAREAAIHHMPSDGQKHNEELVWLVRRLLEAREGTVLAGGPWLPREWMDETGIRQSLSALARKSGAHLIEYGNPQGYLPLREHLVLMLSELGITARASQIVLTQGTSQALDLITRHFIKPGDGVLVDDPGYYNLFGSLRLYGAKPLGVPPVRRPTRRPERLAASTPAHLTTHRRCKSDGYRYEPACQLPGAAAPSRRFPGRRGRHFLRLQIRKPRGWRLSTSSTG